MGISGRRPVLNMVSRSHAQPWHERFFAEHYDRLTSGIESQWAARTRAALLRPAVGVVLEVGPGTGANLPHYRGVRRLILAEPSAAMRGQLVAKLPLGREQAEAVELINQPAELLGLPNASVDVVVATLVLCSVTDPARALAEIRRVLRPAGTLLALEHVRSAGVFALFQDVVTPLWTILGAGCHPNRDTLDSIRAAGFTLSRLETFRPRPRLPVTSPFIVVHAVKDLS